MIFVKASAGILSHAEMDAQESFKNAAILLKDAIFEIL